MRNLLRSGSLTILTGFLLAALPGCRGFLENPFAEEKRAETSTLPAKPAPPALPSKYQLRVAPYVFHSDIDLQRDPDLFTDLAGLRDQVVKELNLPTSDRSVLVYLFEDREAYEKYMRVRYPDLPRRRAFFVAQPRGMGREDLIVFTYWGDYIQQDLRHELTHALLHSVLKDVPLWLDEGLAEYFELPPDRDGVNENHLAHIRRSTVAPFRPDLNRLEALADVGQMTPAEYRESWAWVHFFLRSKPEVKQVVLDYLQHLQHLRPKQKPMALRPRLLAATQAPEISVSSHVGQIEPPPRRTVQR